MEPKVKVVENRARREAARRGLAITKTRRRDPLAIDYGGYMITTVRGKIVAGNLPHLYSFTLDNVVEWLARDAAQAKAAP